MLAAARVLLRDGTREAASGTDDRHGLAGMSGNVIAPWGDSFTGGYKRVSAACVVEMPAEHAGWYVETIIAGLHRIRFRSVAPPEAVAEHVRVLRRGLSFWQEFLVNMTMLIFLRDGIGSVSRQATVVIERTAAGAGRERVVAAVMTLGALNREFAGVVDGTLHALIAAGVSVTGPGWMHTAEVPETSLAHPKTAKRAGIRYHGW